MKTRMYYKDISLAASRIIVMGWMLAGLPMAKAGAEGVIDELEAILPMVEAYEYGSSHVWLRDLQGIMTKVYKEPGLHGDAESLLVGVLEKEIPASAKQMICPFLAPIATARSIPLLQKMLTDERQSALALTVLQYIKDPAADQALVKSLPKTRSLTKTGILNVLGIRENPENLKVLKKLISDADPVVSQAAIDAVGKLKTLEGSLLLKKSYEKSDLSTKLKISDALLACADQMKLENAPEALSIYAAIYESDMKPSVRYAALRGIISLDEKYGERLLHEIINGGNPEYQTLVIPLVRSLGKEATMDIYIDKLPDLGEYQQMQLFTVLAARQIYDIKDFIKEATGNSNPDIRLGALTALKDVANAGDIEFIAQIASRSRGREQDMARECLAMIKGSEVDAVIIQGLQHPDPRVRQEYTRAIETRNMVDGVGSLLGLLQDPDRRVRLEAYRVLGILAGPDQMMNILDAALDAESAAERNEAEKTITLIAMKMTDEDHRIADILTLLPEVQEEASIVMLVLSLGDIGSQAGLPVILQHLRHENQSVQIAAIKSLSVWPDSAPLEELRNLVESTHDLKIHALAMNGYVRMIQIDQEMSEARKGEEITHAFELAESLDEKKLVVSGLSEIKSKEAFQMAVNLLQNTELRPEAEAAVSAIAGPMGNRYPEYTRSELNRIIETTDNTEFKERLLEILKWVD